MDMLFNKYKVKLDSYLREENDSEEVLLQKRIWWLFNILGLPLLLFGWLLVRHSANTGLEIMHYLFVAAILLNLFIFHFYRKGIEMYAFISQLGLVIICSFKVYFLGGLLHAGAPIFIGMIGPVYALSMPNKKRALGIVLLYLLMMIGATLLQPESVDNRLRAFYLYGFIIGMGQIFLVLFYFSHELKRINKIEKLRLIELEEFKEKFNTPALKESGQPLSIIVKMVEQSIMTYSNESVYNNKISNEDGFLNKVLIVLQDNHGNESFGISELSLELGMSRSRLYRKFKTLTDLSVHHFIRDFRLKKAKELLYTTKMNISEIALEVGFKNLSHFSKVFTEKYGNSPSHFKNNNFDMINKNNDMVDKT